MTAPAITVKLDTSSVDMMKVFDTGAFSAVPVLDDEGRLAGVVSTTDLLQKVLASPVGATVRAADLMTTPALVARPDEPLDDAAWRLVAARAHRLVVVEGEAPVGVLSVRDVLGGLLHRRAPEPIATIMTSPVVTIAVGTTIAQAIERLASAGVHGLVVVDGDTPVGLFTHAEALAARRLPATLLEDPVEQVMSAETACFDGATSIAKVAAAAAKMNVRRVLVVEDRRLLGIVSDVDLVHTLSRVGE